MQSGFKRMAGKSFDCFPGGWLILPTAVKDLFKTPTLPGG